MKKVMKAIVFALLLGIFSSMGCKNTAVDMSSPVPGTGILY
jgi:hypothetical protein